MAQAKKTDTEAGRAQLVKQFHAKNTKVFSIFVKGFCWSSWGIGLRKKVKEMPFVDRKRFKEGVSFDAKNQIIHFAHSKGKVNPKKIAQAVDDAGFTAVYLYEMKGKKLVRTELKK